jgi:hypothetical protein
METHPGACSTIVAIRRFLHEWQSLGSDLLRWPGFHFHELWHDMDIEHGSAILLRSGLVRRWQQAGCNRLDTGGAFYFYKLWLELDASNPARHAGHERLYPD